MCNDEIKRFLFICYYYYYYYYDVIYPLRLFKVRQFLKRFPTFYSKLVFRHFQISTLYNIIIMLTLLLFSLSLLNSRVKKATKSQFLETRRSSEIYPRDASERKIITLWYSRRRV